MKEQLFNISHIEPSTHIYGPGARYTVWLQGCTLACKGCWNKEMWPNRPHTLLHREQLLNNILEAPNISGVTLLGGEPLQQAQNTLWLINQLRANSDLTIMLYTGYELTELEELGYWQAIDNTADIVVVGRYQQAQRNINLKWRGSENQRLIYPEFSRLDEETDDANQMEIIISEHGSKTILGYPNHKMTKNT